MATLFEANQIFPGLPLMIIVHIYIMSEAQIELKRTSAEKYKGFGNDT